MTEPDRDERILEHVGLYHVAFRRILARVFFGGREKACENVIDRLIKQKRLRARNLGRSAIKYYQLTAGEAAARGIRHRALGPGGRALPEAIAILWFCTILAQRYRLEEEELRAVFGPGAPHGAHCAEPGDPPRIYRVYVPGPRTKIPTVVKTLDAHVTRAQGAPALSTWIANRLYGVAVLVPTEARAKRIQEAIDSKRIGRGARIIVERTPDTEALPGALYALKRTETDTAGS